MQETLVISLCARKKCTEKFTELFCDEIAVRFGGQIDYGFHDFGKKVRI